MNKRIQEYRYFYRLPHDYHFREIGGVDTKITCKQIKRKTSNNNIFYVFKTTATRSESRVYN